MAQAIKSISITLFSLLILAVSSGFYINKHYCGNELKRISFNQEAPSCHEVGEAEATVPSCHAPAEKTCHTEPVDDCCENENQTFKTDQYTFQHTPINFDVEVFAIVTPMIELLDGDEISNKNTPLNLAESPPGNPSDIQVLYQSFLL